MLPSWLFFIFCMAAVLVAVLLCINTGRCFYVRGGATLESNRAKPPDEGRFVPEGEPPRTKIAPLGESTVARGAHLLAQSGYFSSVPFSRSKKFYPYFLETRAL
jgi:hypothetical protein